MTLLCEQVTNGVTSFRVPPLKNYLHVFPTFFHNMKSRQNKTRFDLVRVFEMHIAPKKFEMHHSQLHIDLIVISRLVGYLDLHSEKSYSKRYLCVAFCRETIKN